jgi:hypothetical protein
MAMNSAMESEYKLLQVKEGGICHFARVTVEAEMQQSGVEVAQQIREPVVEGNGEASHTRFPEWIDAAIRGARLCAEALVQQGKIGGCHVRVVRVVRVEVDTTCADVACAAALATWQALNPEATLPPFKLVDGQWHIEFHELDGFL